jgi:hypothetical protein
VNTECIVGAELAEQLKKKGRADGRLEDPVQVPSGRAGPAKTAALFALREERGLPTERGQAK